MGKSKRYSSVRYGDFVIGRRDGRLIMGFRPTPTFKDPSTLEAKKENRLKNEAEYADFKRVIKEAQKLYMQGHVETRDIIKQLVLDKTIPLYWLEIDSLKRVRIKERRKHQIEDKKIPDEYKIGVRKIKEFIRCSIGERKSKQDILDRLNTDKFLLAVHNTNGIYEKSRETFLNNIFSQTMLEMKQEIEARRAKIYDQDDPR